MEQLCHEVSFAIPSSAGSIPAVVHYPARCPAPVIVCCHGLESSKDGSKFVSIGGELSRMGMAVIRFDFAGCGESRASLGPDLLSGRTRDLRAVLEYVSRQSWSSGKVGLLGSSLGGYIALLEASSGNHPVRAVACWAAPFDLHRVMAALDHSEDLKSLYPPGFSMGSPGTLAALPPVSQVLIVHGQEDESVPWGEALEIYQRVREPRRLVLMETADHRFLDPDCRRMALRVSLDWFTEHGLRPDNRPDGLNDETGSSLMGTSQ